MYQTREHYERATAFGNYDARRLSRRSPVRAYEGLDSGRNTGCIVRRAVLRPQLKELEQRNTLARRNVRALNDRLVQLPGSGSRAAGLIRNESTTGRTCCYSMTKSRFYS